MGLVEELETGTDELIPLMNDFETSFRSYRNCTRDFERTGNKYLDELGEANNFMHEKWAALRGSSAPSGTSVIMNNIGKRVGAANNEFEVFKQKRDNPKCGVGASNLLQASRQMKKIVTSIVETFDKLVNMPMTDSMEFLEDVMTTSGLHNIENIAPPSPAPPSPAPPPSTSTTTTTTTKSK